jgi:hypothetical protein
VILDQRPGEPIGVALDRAVDAGTLGAGDAEQIELFAEWCQYAGHAPGHPKYQPTEAQLRWAAAFVRTERGGTLVLGTDDRQVHAYYAAKLERKAWSVHV